MIGVASDPSEVDLARAIFDVEHADVSPPALMICQRPAFKPQAWSREDRIICMAF